MNSSAHPLPSAAFKRRLLYIHTFGCQMNEYDSLRVQLTLAPSGYELTSDLDSADVIFLNTCSVREKAEQKVFSLLGRLRRHKAHHPSLKIIVAGCLVQQMGKQLLERFDHLDLVIGTQAIGSLPALLREVQGSNLRLAHLPEHEPDHGGLFSAGEATFESGVVAPVTVMQGCDNYCTYCIVPYVRGRERSRPSQEILQEIRLLSSSGAREILLLGQNVNSYGRGLEEKVTFAHLLYLIQAQTDVLRVRFTTSHPKDLTDELIRSFAALPVLCKHLHLPVQAGSDRILKRMKRSYTSAQYLEKIDRLREVCPDIALTSDVMVGFPGETDEDFQDTMRLIERVRFDNLFSFRYSDRAFTKSAGFPDKIDDATKSRRLTELQDLQADITFHKNQAELGRISEVLAEGASKLPNGQLTGRTSQNRIVNFEAPREFIGKLLRLRIVAAFSHSLKGELAQNGQ